METLKADLHIHTREDPYDLIKWDAKRVIDEAARREYRVIAITNHLTICYSDELADYAKDRNIVLIPGCEIAANRRHVLLLNPPRGAERLRSFDEIRAEKRKNHCMAVVAPHPFFPSRDSLRGLFYRNSDVFDAVEWNACYFRWLNFNKAAERAASVSGKPMIGNSDTHFPWQFGTTYSLIEAEPTVAGVIDAVVKGRCKVVTKPLKVSRLTFLLGLKGLYLTPNLPWLNGVRLDMEIEEPTIGAN